MLRLTVLYDARCGLCRAARMWLEAQERLIELHFVAAGSDRARRMFPHLSQADLPEELVVVADDGTVYRNGSAWIMCLYALEEYREWSLVLSRPRILPLARRAFAMLSSRRHRIARLLGFDRETDLVAALRNIPEPTCELPALPRETLAGVVRT